MSNQGKRKESWRNNERHYCAVCNVWMGSDRQSIYLHENGKKHRERVEEQLKEKRQHKQKEEAQSKALQKSLQQMEAAARSSLAQDLRHFVSQPSYSTSTPAPLLVPSFVPPPPPPPPPVSSTQPPLSQGNSRIEKKEWQARKKQRIDDKARPTEGNPEETEQILGPTKKRKLAPDEGHYTQTIDENKEITYLEGMTFGDMLEEEMPIQLWKGSAQATPAEQRLPAYASLWKPALVVSLVRKKEDGVTVLKGVDVAYLVSAEDSEETVEKCVPLSHIRIVLNGNQDERIPDTVEEARILAGYDGEEEVNAPGEVEIDEATGLSSWTTVRVKRTTVRKELQEERARLREQRRLAAVEKAREEKKKEERRMEEAAVQSAGDSALGAYDIWNRGAKEGYKGVNIHSGEDGAADKALSVHDLVAKKISDGQPVEFQKKTSAFKAKKKKQNMRRTSADDD